jgi:nucleoside-diphosphate-sugar epimerase
VRVLVTGATGFVGSHLAEALVARGHTVVALARRPESHTALERLGATPAPGSLEDAGSLDGALEGVAAVFHLAGLTAAGSEAEYLAVNEGGTRRLLQAVERRAPNLSRFVLVSSQAALGPSPRGARLDEDAECRPVTAYGRSKLAAERVVRGSSIPWTIVRPPPVYGPRDREFLRLFRIVRHGIAPVFGTGSQELSLVYVTDLAEAIVRTLELPTAARRIYHAAHQEIVLSRDVARAAGRAIGRRPLLLPVPALLATPIVAAMGRAAAASGRRTVVSTDKMAEFLAPSWLLAVERAERELGWTARTGITEGMALTADWYRREGWLT